MKNFQLGEDKLTFNIVGDFLSGRIKVGVSEKKRKYLSEIRKFVEDHIDSDHAYYGINTGFGKFANVKISADKLKELQVNLIRSHAFGVGEPFPDDVVGLMMLFRAHVVAMGYSAISLPVMDHLIEMINSGVRPVVPSKGSVGASGDLSPLSYLVLAMMGEGEAVVAGKKMAAADALKKAGFKPVKLNAKDGLTLVNGTQAMLALAVIAVSRAERLIKATDISAALSIEGFRASAGPFTADVHKIRGQEGQIKSAATIRALIKGSAIISSHANCPRVQDPYSFRCVPQVHGAVRDAFYYVREIVLREMNGCTDNPLVFSESGKIISGGNFHGEPIAMAMDMLSIAASELGSIAERRIAQLTNPSPDDLPVSFLTKQPGLNSGYFMPHVVATSLVSENKTLAHPASVDSIPTFGGQEDHVSMGMWAARKAGQIIDNVEWIATIEAMAACQAIDLHEKKFEPGVGTKAAYDFVRKHVRFEEKDRYLMPEANRLHEALGEMVKKVVGV